MPKNALPSGSDLNNVVTSCIYEVASGVSHTPYNYGTLICIANNSSSYKCIQIFVRAGGTQMWERFLVSNEWSTWYEIAIDIPSFYKDYSTLSALSSALNVLSFKERGDINPNTITEDGIYWDTSGTHAITGYPCVYIHISRSSMYVVQIAIETSSTGNFQGLKFRGAYYGTNLSNVAWVTVYQTTT